MVGDEDVGAKVSDQDLPVADKDAVTVQISGDVNVDTGIDRGIISKEIAVDENSLQSTTIASNDVTQHHDNVPEPLNDGVAAPEHEIAEEEIRSILQVIASYGKFWHDWNKLKSWLSFQLKQVLSEYPEAKLPNEQQNSSLGESYGELVRRLDEALLGFVEGPPFALQRLCEILLSAQCIYPKLSKLALALEKNLSVTSTLTICTDPYPPEIIKKPDEEPIKQPEEPQTQMQSETVQNGVEPLTGDGDEIMAEVEDADVDVVDDMTIDMETFEDIDVASSETTSTPAVTS